MIDFAKLVVTTSPTLEPEAGASNAIKGDQFLDSKDDKKDDEITIEPNSFILLMAQILTDSVPKVDMKSTASDELNENQQIEASSTDNKDGANKSIKPENGTKVELSEIDELLLTTESTDDKTPVLDSNVALAWIDSEAYTPPQVMKRNEELELDDTILDLNAASSLATESVTLSDELIKQEQALKKINLESMQDNNPKLKLNEDLFQSLQALNSITGNTTSATSKPSYTVDIKQKSDTVITDTSQIAQNSTIFNQTATNAAATSKQAQNLEITDHVLSNPQWSDKFSEHIVWLGQQGIKSAIIKIHPEDLGPLEINISVVKDSASIAITSHNTHVCSIVDQAMPKLREMMAEQGLNLSEVHIGADANSQQSSQQNKNSEENLVNTMDDEVLLTPLNKKAAKGLVDYFA